MNSRKIIHRDIKPDNILVDFVNLKTKEIKICLADFGFAIRQKDIAGSLRCGTPAYMAPEIIKNKNYDEKSDIFSLGATIYTLITNEPLINVVNMQDLFKLVKNLDLSYQLQRLEGCAPPLKDLVSKMLKIKPDKRISCEEALAHPLFK